jgi:hypothetical protein
MEMTQNITKQILENELKRIVANDLFFFLLKYLSLEIFLDLAFHYVVTYDSNII